VDVGGERAQRMVLRGKGLRRADEVEPALRGQPIGLFRRDGPTTITDEMRALYGRGMHGPPAHALGGQRICTLPHMIAVCTREPCEPRMALARGMGRQARAWQECIQRCSMI